MPVLSNARHERFAQALAEGLTADEAYQKAGYSENRGNAIRLKANESIKQRLTELADKAAQKVTDEVGLSRAILLRELAKIALAPIGDENVKVSDKRAAIFDAAKIMGEVIERKEVGAPGEFEAMQDEEIADEVERESAFILAMLPAGNIRPA
jgi:phage terminase small subunit